MFQILGGAKSTAFICLTRGKSTKLFRNSKLQEIATTNEKKSLGILEEEKNKNKFRNLKEQRRGGNH